MDTSLDQVRTRHHGRAVTVVSLFAALGMFFGYARDAGLAGVFGASSATDAFFVATLLPTMLGTVMMGGAFAPALLPVLMSMRQDRGAVWKLVNTVLTLLGLLLVVGVMALVIEPGLFGRGLAPGFDAVRLSMTVKLIVLTAPAVGLLGLSALLIAVLNTFEVYAVPALGATLVNGLAFAALIFASWFGIEAVAVGIVAGALAQCILLVVRLRWLGWRYHPTLALNQTVVQVLRLAIPLLAFIVIAQSVPVIEKIIVSNFSSGQLSQLTYANKLYQIPGLIFTNSIAVVTFTSLTYAAARGAHADYVSTLSASLRNVVFLTAPVATWLYACAVPLVTLIFRRGEFSVQDAQRTAELLQWYSLSVIPASLLALLNRAFYSQHDMLTPLSIGLFNTLVYLILTFAFIPSFQLVGLPLAFFASQVVGLLLSLFALRKRFHIDLSALFEANFWRVGFVGVIWLSALMLLREPLQNIFDQMNTPLNILFLSTFFLVSGLVYLALGQLMGVKEVRIHLASWFRRGSE